jgi:ABC-type hemin transport system substrate-binding protein
VALMADSRAANEWPQVLRGYCSVPSLSTTFALRQDHASMSAAVDQISAAVRARGGRLVLVAADSTSSLTDLGLSSAVVGVDTTVEEDARLLEQRPDHLVDLPIQVWLGAVG